MPLTKATGRSRLDPRPIPPPRRRRRRHPVRAALALPALVLLRARADPVHARHRRPAQGEVRDALGRDVLRRRRARRIQAHQPPVGAAREDRAERHRRADRDRGPPLLRAPRHRLQAHRRRARSARSRATCRAARRSRSSSRATSIRRRSAARPPSRARSRKRSPRSRSRRSTPSARSSRRISTPCRSCSTRSASRWRRAPISTSPPTSSTCWRPRRSIGMLKATSAFNPGAATRSARAQRRNLVLAQMAKHGKLTQAQLATLTQASAQARFRAADRAARPRAAHRRSTCANG